MSYSTGKCYMFYLIIRFMRGFVKTKDNVEENEKIAHSEFLFKKLKF